MEEFIKSYHVAQMGLYVTQIVNNFKFLKSNVEREVSGVMTTVSLGLDTGLVDLGAQVAELEGEKKRFMAALEVNRARLRLIRATAEQLRDVLRTAGEAQAEQLQKVFNTFLLEYLFKHEMRSTINFMRIFQRKEENFIDLGMEKYTNFREIAVDLQRSCTEKLGQWCRTNRSKLKRVKSDLEFKVQARNFYLLASTADDESLLDFIQAQVAPLTPDPDCLFELLRVLMEPELRVIPPEYSIQSLTSEFCQLYFEIEGFNKNYFLENIVAVT